MRIIKINSWKELQNVVAGKDFRSWAFRGQADANWSLEPTLRRYFLNYKIHPSVWSKQEKRVFRIFKRKAHQFLEHLPKDGDAFEWLAIMQHHGAPTRLLDFTWSPYVAAFFALQQATTDSAIWAVFPSRLRNTLKVDDKDHNEIGPWKSGNYEEFFIPNTHNFIAQGEPYRMNRRLIAQSGSFIIPSRIDRTVTEILDENELTESCLVKFELDTEAMRHETLRNLYNMNITNATLFPDLDGLAKSMALEFELHWAYDPVTGNRYDGFDDDPNRTT